MAGLARLCKMYGRMHITSGDQSVIMVWDYACDQAVPITEMPIGSKRWQNSELVKWRQVEAQLPQPTPPTSVPF